MWYNSTSNIQVINVSLHILNLLSVKTSSNWDWLLGLSCRNKILFQKPRSQRGKCLHIEKDNLFTHWTINCQQNGSFVSISIKSRSATGKRTNYSPPLPKKLDGRIIWLDRGGHKVEVTRHFGPLAVLDLASLVGCNSCHCYLCTGWMS